MSLLSRKSLFVEMALLRLRVRYKQSLLGWAWAILPPLVLMITYTVVFYKVAGFTTGDLPGCPFHFFGSDPLDVFVYVDQYGHRRYSDQ